MNEAEPAPLLLSLAERAALATCVRATTDELGVVDHEHDTELAALRSALVKLEEGPTP